MTARDGGKGDARRPLVIPEEQFNNNWDAIFNKKDLVKEAPYQPGYEDAVPVPKQYITPED